MVNMEVCKSGRLLDLATKLQELEEIDQYCSDVDPEYKFYDTFSETSDWESLVDPSNISTNCDDENHAETLPNSDEEQWTPNCQEVNQDSTSITCLDGCDIYPQWMFDYSFADQCINHL